MQQDGKISKETVNYVCIIKAVSKNVSYRQANEETHMYDQRLNKFDT